METNRYMNLTDSQLNDVVSQIWHAADINAQTLKEAFLTDDWNMAAKASRNLDYLEGLWNELQDEISYRESVYES